MAKEFWVDVALDYDKDQAWIMRQSDDCRDVDLLNGGSEIDDNGIDGSWAKDVEPGLYRLTLCPWSHQSYEGEHDCGIDVVKAECLTPFPRA